jgi:hypothetical protein
LILSVFSLKFGLKYQHIYVMYINVNYNMDWQKTQLFPFPYWLTASCGRGTFRFLPSIHLAAKSKIMAGAFSPI